MSSYSEYLGRYKQRMVTITDTRPRRDAGHQTEIVRRLAASGNLETRVANTACALVLNAPSTASASTFLHGGGHTVQDAPMYTEYTAGQAVAQGELRRNAKASSITNTMPCLSTSALPEINDRIALVQSTMPGSLENRDTRRAWSVVLSANLSWQVSVTAG